MPTTEIYSRIEDLLDVLDDYPDDTVDDADLQNALEKGHQRMETRIGRYFEETYHPTEYDSSDELRDTVKLSIRPVLKVVEIVHNRTLVDSSNYTVDKEAGEIDFDDTWWDDNASFNDAFTIRYIPKIYSQIEVWWAAQRLKNGEIVQFDDSETVSLEKNARRQAITLENDVNRLTGPGSATDGTVRRGTK